MDETFFCYNADSDEEDYHHEVSSFGNEVNYFFKNPSFQMSQSNILEENKVIELQSLIMEYKEKLRLKQKELSDFTHHADLLEEEFNAVSADLSIAEKKISTFESKCHHYESIIRHLREELELLKQNASIQNTKLSFSGEFDSKNVQSRIFNEKEAEEEDFATRLQLHEHVERLTYETEELRTENEALKRENHKLTKDLEDIEYAFNTRNNNLSKKMVVNSTPLKPSNFMTYDALGLKNCSFSFDDDFSALGPNLFPQISDVENSLSKNLERSSTKSEASIIPSIDKEEMPSFIVSNRTVNNASFLSPTYLLTRPESRLKSLETFNQENNSDISTLDTLENEKFPDIQIPYDSDFMSNSSESSNQKMISPMSSDKITQEDYFEFLLLDGELNLHKSIQSSNSSIDLVQSLEDELKNCQVSKDQHNRSIHLNDSLTSRSMSVCSIDDSVSDLEFSISSIDKVETFFVSGVNNIISSFTKGDIANSRSIEVSKICSISICSFLFNVSSLLWFVLSQEFNHIWSKIQKLSYQFFFEIKISIYQRLSYSLTLISIILLIPVLFSIGSDTWILPYYSLQEILQDFITQICRFQ